MCLNFVLCPYPSCLLLPLYCLRTCAHAWVCPSSAPSLGPLLCRGRKSWPQGSLGGASSPLWTQTSELALSSCCCASLGQAHP
jgi:hypothetical protein